MQLENIFPYPTFRPGQLEVATSVYKAAKEHRYLVIEAMSGFGKTAPVLAGSILAAEEGGGRVVYACRTKRQVFRVMEEIGRIQSRVPVRATCLFSKSDYCLLKERSHFPIPQDAFKWYCSFNVGNNLCYFFLNMSLLNREVSSLVQRLGSTNISHSNFLSRCREAHVCPYEVARLAIADSKVIVTTYHYLFDDASRSILFSNTGASPSEVAVVMDEAHNIRDFARDTFTTSISIGDLTRACKDSRILHLDRTATSLQDVAGTLETLCSENQSWYVDKAKLKSMIAKNHDPAWLPNLVLELSTSAKMGWEAIATGRNLPVSILKAGKFIEKLIASYALDEVSIAKSGQTLFLVNTNPSNRFVETTRGYRSVVLLSATVSPSDLFLKSIGLEPSTTVHRVNPSTEFRVQTIIDTGVTTRFKSRTPELYKRITAKLAAIFGSIDGGIGVFMPSYAMLESMRVPLQTTTEKRNVLYESRDLGSAEAEQTMHNFKSTPGSILLAVQGGRFSEGEDFPGDQMDASIVVGLSLPPPSPVMYAEYARTNLSRHETYLVVSLLPAVRKAIQSAGRHIRSPDKQGMVFFLDSRFNNNEIMQMMPSWLKHNLMVGDFEFNEMQRTIKSFWSR